MTSHTLAELDVNLRRRIETLTDCLINLLDNIDGDSDMELECLEDDGDSGIADEDALALLRSEIEIIGCFAENLALKYSRPEFYRLGSFHRGLKRA